MTILDYYDAQHREYHLSVRRTERNELMTAVYLIRELLDTAQPKVALRA